MTRLIQLLGSDDDGRQNAIPWSALLLAVGGIAEGTQQKITRTRVIAVNCMGETDPNDHIQQALSANKDSVKWVNACFKLIQQHLFTFKRILIYVEMCPRVLTCSAFYGKNFFKILIQISPKFCSQLECSVDNNSNAFCRKGLVFWFKFTDV